MVGIAAMPHAQDPCRPKKVDQQMTELRFSNATRRVPAIKDPAWWPWRRVHAQRRDGGGNRGDAATAIPALRKSLRCEKLKAKGPSRSEGRGGH
jgi:hypothetical protein